MDMTAFLWHKAAFGDERLESGRITNIKSVVLYVHLGFRILKAAQHKNKELSCLMQFQWNMKYLNHGYFMLVCTRCGERTPRHDISNRIYVGVPQINTTGLKKKQKDLSESGPDPDLNQAEYVFMCTCVSLRNVESLHIVH